MFDLNIQMSQYLQQFLEAKMYKKNWHLVNSFYQMEIDNMLKIWWSPKCNEFQPF